MGRNTGRQVLILFLGATVLWGVVDQSSRGFDATRFGELIGAGLVFTLFGLLVALVPAVIFKLMRHQWPKWYVWLAVPFMVAFMYCTYVGTSHEVSIDDLDYSASPGSVDRRGEGMVIPPGEPEVRTGNEPDESWQ